MGLCHTLAGPRSVWSVGFPSLLRQRHPRAAGTMLMCKFPGPSLEPWIGISEWGQILNKIAKWQHSGFETSGLGCKTLAARSWTFYLCNPRTSPPVWDIRRQSTVFQKNEGVPPYKGNRELNPVRLPVTWLKVPGIRIEIPAPQTSSSSCSPMFGLLAPLSHLIEPPQCLPGWEERRWFVFRFTKQIHKFVSFPVKRAKIATMWSQEV